LRRPRRYPRDLRLSSIADQIQVIEDEMWRTDDVVNAAKARTARSLIVDIALGEPRERTI
jgi:hypothetical protein